MIELAKVINLDDTDNEDMQSMGNNSNVHFQQEELTNGGIESSSHCNALVLTSKKRSNRCLDFPVDSLVDELILKTRRTALQTQGVSQGTEIIPIYHQPIVYHHNLLSKGDDGEAKVRGVRGGREGVHQGGYRRSHTKS